MKLTTRFGEIEVDDNACITLEEGLVGLPELKRFCLISEREASPIQWLQCVDEPEVALPVVDPMAFYPDYSFELQDADAADLGIQSPGETVVLATVTVDNDNRRVTTNLLGPIVLNPETRRAKQVILSSDNYSPKMLLFELNKKPFAERSAARPEDQAVPKAA